jgi:geranylgeranyl diphosphate synthase type II
MPFVIFSHGAPVNSFDLADLRGAFTAYLPVPAKLEPHLREALRRVLENPGSLVRPRLVFQMAIAYGLSHAHAKDLAIALEYFHTASLLFDDLPCMDNAFERRGTPCVHLEFGEAGAILASLALINRAYALTWLAVSAYPPECQIRTLAYIEEHLGVGGLLNGQSLDLHYSTLPNDLATTERIARGKTVSLIQLALVLPALLGGAPKDELRLLERIAEFWGLSYQILDDLKDVLQSSAETGKTVSRDVELGRPNIALAIGIPGALQRLARLTRLGDKALRRLSISRPAVSFLQGLQGDLHDETGRVTQNAFEIVMREPA